MVSVNECTPSETACTETRVLSASVKSPKRIPFFGAHHSGKFVFLTKKKTEKEKHPGEVGEQS